MSKFIIANMWIERDISECIRLAAQKFAVVVLTGARQVGKTELLKRLFPSHNYVSLDLPSVAASAAQDPETFFVRYPRPALIDEVQYAPELWRHLKSIVDTERQDPGQFILTGSQKFALMQGISESLTGRAAILELETLSAREITATDRNAPTAGRWAELIVRGGFPALSGDPEMPLDLFFSSYLATYLERDVRQLLNVSSLRHFERFLRACAARNAQLLDKSALAADVGVSATTIAQWLGVLQASNQIVLLEPWFKNLTKRIVKSPKLYFSDTGLLCHLLGITKDAFTDSPFNGAVWECYVFSELRKLLAKQAQPLTLFFYRDKQQLEVDFLLMGGNVARILECKWTEFPDAHDAKNLGRLMDIFLQTPMPETSHVKSFVVCRTPNAFPIGTVAQAVNLLELDSVVDPHHLANR